VRNYNSNNKLIRYINQIKRNIHCNLGGRLRGQMLFSLGKKKKTPCFPGKTFSIYGSFQVQYIKGNSNNFAELPIKKLNFRLLTLLLTETFHQVMTTQIAVPFCFIIIIIFNNIFNKNILRANQITFVMPAHYKRIVNININENVINKFK
jgi:hypothetical protein